MKIVNYLYKAIVIFFLVGVLGSCRKFVDIEPAPNLINSEAVFTSDVTALAALSGVYAQMRQLSNGITNGGLPLFTGLSGDELYNTASNPMYDPFYRDSIPATSDRVERNFWTDAYGGIYRVNALIEGLTGASGVSESQRRQLLGEAYLVRGLQYFYLVNLFGDIPLVTATDHRASEKMPRTSVSRVYEQITADLTEAENLLSPAYPSPGKVRPNRWTATALLARVNLYRQNWQQAEQKATEVINSGNYSLVPNLDHVFLKNSPETIWELAPRNETGNTVDGTNFIPSTATARPAFALTASLLDRFDSSDKRKASWIQVRTVSSTTYAFPNKYKIRTSTPVSEYYVLLRLAEQYLIRSEARAQQGDIAGSQADLNQVRGRAGLDTTTASTREELLLAIEEERRVELAFEWGHRWFDLKRTGRIDAVLSAEKPFWRPFAALYPIPYNQIQVNGTLTQNPGY